MEANAGGHLHGAAQPPPIIRLRAIAEDFAGKKDEDVAEFPTGDWHGKFEWKHVCQGGGSTDETRGTRHLSSTMIAAAI